MGSHLREADAPHESRYHVPHKPPENLYSIFRKLAKAVRDPDYKKHGGFHNSEAIRSRITEACAMELGDADDVLRFLKRYGILLPNGDENDPRDAWKFDPEQADALYAKVVSAGTADAKERTIVSYCDRISHPDAQDDALPSSGEHVIEPVSVEKVASPAFPFAEADEAFLEELQKDLQRQRTESVNRTAKLDEELGQIGDERHRRAERVRLAEELEATRSEKQKALLRSQELEERELDITRRLRALDHPTY